MAERKESGAPDGSVGEHVGQFADMGISDLEAAAFIAIEEGRDPKLPLSRMFSLSRQDEESARAYLDSMERLTSVLATDEQYWQARLAMARAAEFIKEHEYVDQLYGELVALDPNLKTAAGRTAFYNNTRAIFERGEQDVAIARYRQLWELSARYSSDEFDTFGTQLASAYAMVEDWENVLEVAPAVIGPLDEVRGFMLALTLARANEKLERFGEAAKLYQRLFNARKKIDADNPGHDLHRLGEAYDARNMELRWRSASAKHEGQQHRLAAAEFRENALHDKTAEAGLKQEQQLEAGSVDRGEAGQESVESPEPLAVESQGADPGATTVRYWWAWTGVLALMGIATVYKLMR